MAQLDETLSERVQKLTRRPILSTTGTRAAVDSLAARTQALEDVVRELTTAVQELAESQRRDRDR